MYILSRGHPKVKKVDMVHAADYANMEMDQMMRKMKSAQKQDDSMARAIK